MSDIILGIESSCDDTSAAVIKDGYLLSNVLASQDVHKAYGGVIPELASRAHQLNIVPVVSEAINRAGISPEDIYLNSRDKMEDFNDFCTRHDLRPEEVMYFGDDLPDIPVMKACGCGAAPSDAVEEAIQAADFVSSRIGGKGCVREGIETVMKSQGTWVLDVQDYKEKF